MLYDLINYYIFINHVIMNMAMTSSFRTIIEINRSDKLIAVAFNLSCCDGIPYGHMTKY